jgi:hypothetical protein
VFRHDDEGMQEESLLSGYFSGKSPNLLHDSMMHPFASGTI